MSLFSCLASLGRSCEAKVSHCIYCRFWSERKRWWLCQEGKIWCRLSFLSAKSLESFFFFSAVFRRFHNCSVPLRWKNHRMGRIRMVQTRNTRERAKANKMVNITILYPNYSNLREASLFNHWISLVMIFITRWYAKRFLHPDIVAPYDYVFIWDEDLGLENFDVEECVFMLISNDMF